MSLRTFAADCFNMDLELQDLQSQTHGASPNTNTRLAAPTSDRFLAAPGHLPSNPTSSAGNSSTQFNVPKSRNARSSLWKSLRKWWLELAGAVSSILFLTGIVAFLALIDGTKLDDWHFPWQIKPPTIISILVTVCRINLAFFIAEGIGQLKWVFFEQREHSLSDFDQFDEATRDPWGATCFIWKVNRRALVATCGAAMAILILAMDPFSQQVLYYASQTTEIENAIATIPSAQFYDSGALYAALSGVNGTATYNPDPLPSSLSGPTAFGSIPRAREAPDTANSGRSRSVKRDELTPGSLRGSLF